MSLYYFGLAMFGLWGVLTLAFLILQGTLFGIVLQSPVSVALGIIVTLTAGHVLDKLGAYDSPTFRLWGAAPLIFFSGVFVSSAANGIESLGHWHKEIPLTDHFAAYFSRPLFWLCLIGLPSSLLVGRVYPLLFRMLP